MSSNCFPTTFRKVWVYFFFKKSCAVTFLLGPMHLCLWFCLWDKKYGPRNTNQFKVVWYTDVCVMVVVEAWVEGNWTSTWYRTTISTVLEVVGAGCLVKGCQRICQNKQSLSPTWHVAEILPMGCRSQRLYTYQPIHCEISRPGQP